MNSWAVRPEAPGDEAAIRTVTSAAFAPMPHSNGDEARIVEELRDAGALAVSLVAEDDAILGHVAFSPVTIGDGSRGWYGLGPVSVVPERQNEGIGGALIETGLARLRESAAAGCVVLGEPAYYRRFGFVHDPDLVLPGPPPRFFQALALGGSRASGVVSYHPAFAG